jgi:hypothetical protein
MYGEPVGLVPLDYADDKLITFKPVKGDIILQVHGNVTGAIAKTLLKSIGFCKLCRADLKTEVSSEEHKLIEAREYKPNILFSPRSKFVVLFGLCSQVTSHYLPILCAENNFHTKLVLIINENTNIKSDIFTSCMEHNLFQMFVTNFVHFYCFTWVCNVNRILRGSLLCSTLPPHTMQLNNKHLNFTPNIVHVNWHCEKQNSCNRLRRYTYVTYSWNLTFHFVIVIAISKVTC